MQPPNIFSVDHLRVGHGFDIHQYDSTRKGLTLCGEFFEDCTAVQSHSDGDAPTHAGIDALLSAANLGDIGEHFPDTAKSNSDISSLAMLSAVAKMLEEASWRVLNLDLTVVCDSPNIADRKTQMTRNLSEILAAPVSIKGKRTEGVESFRQGLQSFAVALMVKN